MLLWQIPVLLRVFVANGLAQVLIKKNASSLGRTKRFFLQFLFCSLIMSSFAFVSGHLLFNTTALVIVLMGIFNGLAVYFQWQAIDISMSKNAIFTFWDDVTAMVLAYFFLNESSLLNKSLILGIVLSFSSVIMFSFYSYNKSKKVNNIEIKNRLVKFLTCIAIYSFIWGVLVFLIKYMALKSVPALSFLTFWYLGSFLIASLILAVNRQVGESIDLSFPWKDVRNVLMLSITITSSMALTYWAYRSAPLTISQPIFLVGEMILPALLGLYYFKEIKELNLKEKLIFLVGVIGGLIVIINF